MQYSFRILHLLFYKHSRLRELYPMRVIFYLGTIYYLSPIICFHLEFTFLNESSGRADYLDGLKNKLGSFRQKLPSLLKTLPSFLA